MSLGGLWDDQASRRARGALAIGGILLLLGLALVGIGPSDVGAAVALAALLITVYGIHTFGRLGPELGAPRRRKRKKKPASPAAEDA